MSKRSYQAGHGLDGLQYCIPISRPGGAQLDARRVETGVLVEHDVLLPPGLVEHERAHHGPRAPQPLAEVLPRAFLGAPRFEARGDDAGDHDDGVLGADTLLAGVHADGEGVVVDGIAFLFLHKELGQSALV